MTLTTEKFIEKARKIHGVKYIYSKVSYIRGSDKVIIICPEHGEFVQTPNSHLNKNGCPKCGSLKRINSLKFSQEEFIALAKKVHGEKYNYSKVDYKKNNIKVDIICPKHGVFKQKPCNHLKKQGCPICARDVKTTTEQFIKKAQKVHGDFYDYSQTDYKKNYIKIKIICKIHGSFYSTPANHLRGNKCPKCMKEVVAEKRKLTNQELIKRFQQVHGDQYDYSEMNYVSKNAKIKIICKLHGPFMQFMLSHIRGAKCPSCLKVPKKNIEKYEPRLTTEEFIEKARKVHGNKYDYSQTEYIKSCLKVKIICPEHGVFEQTPSNHLYRGCPYCRKQQGNDKKRLSQEEFFNLSRTVHNNKYDYSQAVYKDLITKIEIICPKHGKFHQTPRNHLQKHGCIKCFWESFRYNQLTTGLFIKKATQVHGDFYDYTQVDYKDCYTNIRIGCPNHGFFFQAPFNHLYGHECPKCAYNLIAEKLKLTTQEFIEKAHKVHGDRYDYSEVAYNVLKVKIICKSHGEFMQCPHAHLKGEGCPVCSESKGEKRIAALLDSFKVDYQREKTFEGCIHKRKLYFDFYVPSKNTCIEFDGQQHFVPLDYFGGEKALETIKKLDGIKNKFCQDNKINLIRLTYKDNDEAIAGILKNFS